MAFKLTPAPTFKAKVELSIPGTDSKGSIEFEFKFIRPADMPGFMETMGEKPLAEGMAEVIVGWSGVVDESGVSVPYTPQAFKDLCANYYAAGQEVMTAWREGSVGARRKN